MKVSKVVRSVLMAAAVLLSQSALMASAAPKYQVTLTMSGYAGASALKDFPVLVRLAEGSPSGFFYDQLRDDAADLAFRDADGNPLAYEIDTWDTDGTSLVWVRVPVLTKDTQIVATWGDPDVTTPTEYQSGAKVWGEAGYAGVWHMDETDNQGTSDYVANDASGNEMTAVPMTSGDADFTQMVSDANGAIGRARVNQSAVNTKKIGLKVDGYKAIAEELATKGGVSVSGWFKVPVSKSTARLFGQKKVYNDADGFEMEQGGTARAANANPSIYVGALPLNTWCHVGFVIRGADEMSSLCLNGTEKTGSSLVLVANEIPFVIGNDGNCDEAEYVGSYDEVRIFKGPVPTDWIKAEYDTVANNAFYAAGEVVILASPDQFIVDASRGLKVGDVNPAYGTTEGLEDGQVVGFSAPSFPVDLGDGRRVAYVGHALYGWNASGMAWDLLAESDSLSGSYTHTAGQAVRLVWKQAVFSSGEPFAAKYSSIISIPGYALPETEFNLPVLVRISENHPEGFSYDDCQPNGADIFFVEANGMVIPHEIERWDPNGESLVWVSVPVVRTGTTFRFCYGNAEVTTARNNPAAVWTDAGFAGVWHLNEASAEDFAHDATGGGHDGVPTSVNSGTDQMVAVADGAVGGARQISTDAINWFAVPTSSAFQFGSTFTVSAWVRGLAVYGARMFGRKPAWSSTTGWEVEWTAPTAIRVHGSAADSPGGHWITNSEDKWIQVTWTFDGPKAMLYLDGTAAASEPDTVTPVIDNDEPFEFGNTRAGGQTFNGAFDEVRLSGGAKSAARLKLEHDVVSNADFLSPGAVVQTAAADTFSVEPGDVERGVPTPAWGKMTGLTDGQVIPFSAPAELQATDDPKVKFRFSGHELYVAKGGIESLVERTSAIAGSYTHVAGQGVRLVWFTQDMPLIEVAVSGSGTVEGAGYSPLGETTTLTAVPAEGFRFIRWEGDLPEGVSAKTATISFVVDRPRALTAKFSERPSMAAFFSWAGHAEDETVTVEAAGNDAGTETFGASSVNLRGTNEKLATFSTACPGTIYSDATCTEVLARKPGSIHFDSTTPRYHEYTTGGSDITYPDLLGWISRQKIVTLELFARTENYYAALAGAWSYEADGDLGVLYCSAYDWARVAFSIEKSSAGWTGNVESSTPEQGATARCMDSWQHLAVVFDVEGQKIVLYRNYCLVGEKSIVLNRHEVGEVLDFYLGSMTANASRCFAGWISAMRVTKGELTVDDFMRVKLSASAGDTVALWDFRGRAGTTVGTLKPLIGDGDVLTGVPCEAASAPTFIDDVPGVALYANAEQVAARNPLSKRVGAIETTPDKQDHLLFTSLSTALSECDSYTIEFFAKCVSGAAWSLALDWNDIARDARWTANMLQIPGGTWNADEVRMAIEGCGGSEIRMGQSLLDDTWHHYAVVYDQSTDCYTLVFDYNQSLSISAAGKRAYTVAGLGYGGRPGSGSGNFGGKLSCLRITKRALAPEEFMVAGPKPPSGLTIIIR